MDWIKIFVGVLIGVVLWDVIKFSALKLLNRRQVRINKRLTEELQRKKKSNQELISSLGLKPPRD